MNIEMELLKKEMEKLERRLHVIEVRFQQRFRHLEKSVFNKDDKSY